MGAPTPTVINGEKQCTKCKHWKPLADFCNSKRHVTGRTSWCKKCFADNHSRKDPEEHWEYNIRQKYGVTLEEYDELFAAQGGVCYLCREPETRQTYGKTTRLAIDHCHKTGRIRSLLCASCNLQLGRAKENVVLWQRMIDYINSQGVNDESNRTSHL